MNPPTTLPVPAAPPVPVVPPPALPAAPADAGLPGGVGQTLPLAPSSFTRPVPPRRSKRLIILLGGGTVVLLLLAAAGIMAYQLFFVGESEPVVSPSPVSSVPVAVISPQQSVVPATTVDPNREVADEDGDGLNTAEERFYGTDAGRADTDADGYKDGEEVRGGFDPLGPGKLDSDNDGFPDPDERAFGSDPFNPDTDSDGYSDGEEIANGYNPLIKSPGDKL